MGAPAWQVRKNNVSWQTSPVLMARNLIPLLLVDGATGSNLSGFYRLIRHLLAF
jgi:hypothetical protein